jgi:hypothetical protein
MPPEAISMPGTLYLYADWVRILAGRQEAVLTTQTRQVGPGP